MQWTDIRALLENLKRRAPSSAEFCREWAAAMNNGSLDALIAFAGKDDEAALERAKKGEWEREKDMIARNRSR